MVSPDTAAKSPAEVATGETPPVVVVTPAASSLVLELTLVSAGTATAEEPAPAVVTGGVSEFDVVVFPAAGTDDGELAIEVVTGGSPPLSDDELEGNASSPWDVVGCTGVFVCCSMLVDVCESEVLGPCPPASETEVSVAIDRAVLEGDALDSSCAVEPSWEEVTPLPGCSNVDEWVACGTASFPLV